MIRHLPLVVKTEDPRDLVATVFDPSGSDGIAIGTLSRGDGLWRNARLSLRVDGATIEAIGMADAMTALRDAANGLDPLVILTLHDGYDAIYGPDGAVAARIMRTADGWSMRRMDPHLAVSAKDYATCLQAAMQAIS